MSQDNDDPFRPLIAKLEALSEIDERDREAVRSLPFIGLFATSGEYLVRERQRETSCCVLLEGIACRHKATARGDRQIVSFHVRGDLLDAQSLLFSKSDHNIQTITQASYLVVPSEDLKRVVDARPNLAEALWRDTFIDGSIFREWVLNVGRRDGRSRIAHMLCEFVERCSHAGLGAPHEIAIPMTRADIGDATGLTHVHVNRLIGQLVAEALITVDRDGLRIVDWDRMRDTSAFDPAYLHEAA